MKPRIWVRYVLWAKVKRPFVWIADKFFGFLTPFRAGSIILAVALWIYLSEGISLSALKADLLPELIGIAATVLIFDAIYRRRADDVLRESLIHQLASGSNDVAAHALAELKARGWLLDGTLRGAFLLSADLDGLDFTGADMRGARLFFSTLQNTSWLEADLSDAELGSADLNSAVLTMYSDGHNVEADLDGASLGRADLTDARVREAQLVKTNSLWWATMPDGELYDGRYRLPRDLELFTREPQSKDKAEEWARFYGVDLNRYLEGQAWADTNLDQLRRESS